MGRSLTEMGTSRRDFVELGTLLASKTGGMAAAPLVATMRGTRMTVAKLCLGGTATADKADALFSLMAEVLTDTNFDNPQRFTQMVLEERARLEQSRIPAGLGTGIARLRAAYSLAGRISEANFNLMLDKTQKEQAELNDRGAQGRKKLADEMRLAMDAKQWVDAIQEYADITELDAATLNRLIKEIVVHEHIDSDKTRHISIEIHFNLKPIPEVEQVKG